MIVAVILMVMIVCMGAVVAVFIGMYMVQRTIQRHQHIVQKRALAEKYIVLDRSEWQHGSSASHAKEQNTEQRVVSRSPVRGIAKIPHKRALPAE